MTPRIAEPGPGQWTIVDVENQIKILKSRLRGLYQPASPVWADSELLGPALGRRTGRALVALISLSDENDDFAFGWATSDPTDPRTNGHGWLAESAIHKAISPGRTVNITTGGRFCRSMQYLIVVVLNATGAYTLVSTFGDDSGAQGASPDQVGIPCYPLARVLWVDDADTTPTLLPYISAFDSTPGPYPNGHAVEDVRVVDVWEWTDDDWLAFFLDRFDRPDSTVNLGTAWLPINGTWGLSSGRAYNVAGSGFRTIYAPTDHGGDGIYSWSVTLTGTATDAFRLTLRHNDADDFVCLNSDGTSSALKLQRWVNHAFSANLSAFTLPTALVAGSTYRFVLVVKGNRYLLFQDGVPCNAANWEQDVGNTFLTAGGVGFGVANANPSLFSFENVGVYPLMTALPGRVFSDGASPRLISSGTTLGLDSFTDPNGTRLQSHTAGAGGAWTEHTGTWTIQSNRATVAAVAGANYVTQNLGGAHAECSVDIITPASFPTNSIRCGIALRFTNDANKLFVRLFYDGTGELEIVETIGGSGGIVKKTTIQPIAPNTTYRLKAQVLDDLLLVFLDGRPRLTYFLRDGLPASTRFGLYRDGIDVGCMLDNWVAKSV